MPSYSPPPPSLELEVTSYTSVGTVNDTVVDEPQWIRVTNAGMVIIRGYDYVFVVTPSLTITHTSAQRTANISRQSCQGSATNKYVVVDLNNTTINVYKNGTLLQQLTKTGFYSSTTSERSVGISPNGKYIAVAGYDSTGTYLHVQLFVGS